MSTTRILIECATYTTYATAIIGLLKFTSLTKDLRIVFTFVLLGSFNEIFTDLFKVYISKNTMPIGHFYIPISILILGYFYLQVLKGYIKQVYLLVAFGTYLLFAIINPVFIQSYFDFPNIVGASGAIVLVVSSILLFTKIMEETNIPNLWQAPIVWINLAILLYYSGNFFFYILFNYSLQHSLKFATKTVNFYNVLNILFYILLSVGFLKTKKQSPM